MPIAPHLPCGTRQTSTELQQSIPPTTRSVQQSLSADLGIKKLVVASITFGAASGQIQAGSGTFAYFAAGDTVEVEGSNLNNGVYLVTATDASTQLTVQGGVKNEGPVSNVTVRAI